ncbi:competence protein ComGD [Leuconostocaceae bacterium R-53105]|uniref:Competence protein ComGD n=2 Tax=Convivina intestini TaxID=1505726 RepID=A0A2U1D638_9LACO|nr:prepilin-type N-terminal cleavage/methylation domain-containing protein [Convivina intestini]PVY83059.1 competence protein ComGD [Convivina intestini]CAH1851054.1 hypothetical protein R078131_00216 [Convivina intestini]CAH1856474.1 hypothetical protein R077811_01260 [Convivina intestini]SDB98923.1 competence protein ComGD [Leuconostocaceae bacterium R-53105]
MVLVKMKPINKAFTLVEALVTLAVVALLILIGGHHFSSQPGVKVDQWQTSFDSHWQHARNLAQGHGQAVNVNFGLEAVSFNQTTLTYPKNYRCHQNQLVKILPTGYVAPTTIVLENGLQQKLAIIFSLGGGDYRFQIEH